MKLWRGQPDNWNPPQFGAKEKGRFWVGFAIIFLFLALDSFTSPSSSPLSGKWGWLHRIFFNTFGASGDIILYLVVGAAALLYGLIKLFQRES